MTSIFRTIQNIRTNGLKHFFRQMTYIGDAKGGKCVGTDQFGNKYYEELDWQKEIPGRHRWIDFSQDDFNASQVPPEWHSWLHHIRQLPPPEDPIMIASRPPWLAPFRENLTGTRAQNKTYSTTAPKIRAWDPVVKSRFVASAFAADAASTGTGQSGAKKMAA